MTWRWVIEDVVLAIHGEQLAEHGGSNGLRDKALPDSALVRSKNLAGYREPSPDVADLAASYAIGIVRNHPFVDGNKRAAFVVAEIFIALNGYELTADASSVTTVLRLAERSIAEKDFADWILANLAKARTQGWFLSL